MIREVRRYQQEEKDIAEERQQSEEEEENNENDDDFEVEPPVIVFNPRVPRWRQPLKNPDFSNTKPDDRCPCGSGRKYKNCHGRGKPA